MGAFNRHDDGFHLFNAAELLISSGISVATFPPDLDVHLGQVVTFTDEPDPAPWTILDVWASPLLDETKSTNYKLVMSAEAAHALLGSLQARLDDARANGLPVGKADQLDAVRADSHKLWTAGVARLRAVYDRAKHGRERNG